MVIFQVPCSFGSGTSEVVIAGDREERRVARYHRQHCRELLRRVGELLWRSRHDNVTGKEHVVKVPTQLVDAIHVVREGGEEPVPLPQMASITYVYVRYVKKGEQLLVT